MKKGKILIVDDNQGIRTALKLLLSSKFSEIELLSSPKNLISTMDIFRPDVVLLDMNFESNINSGNEGLFWAGELRQRYPDSRVVLFTAYADITLAVEGMKRGAYDFITKPWDNQKLINTLESAYNNTAAGKKSESTALDKMYWGDSIEMELLNSTVSKVAPTDVNILITGENGTGKDMLANEIHQRSSRSHRPMICVDAGAITDTLFESELFGHVKGAFTDAISNHIGKFEQANGGTLFLDEIGNIPSHLQAKLLRVLQNRTITRLGSEKQIPIDIRLICATNMNLEKMVKEGKFREDLFYRINTIQLHLPALRERRSEIIPLTHIFLKLFNQKYHRHIDVITPEATTMLESHSWNGNIRELKNVIEKAVILSDGNALLAQDISINTTPRYNNNDHSLDRAEEDTIRNAIKLCNGNLSLAAKELGISRSTLYCKIKKYNIG